MEKRQEKSDNLGSLFWCTASAFPNHTAVLYLRDGEWKVVTYDALKTEAVQIRVALSHHDPRTQQTSKDEAQYKSQAAESLTTTLVGVDDSQAESHGSEVQVVGILSSGPEAVACILGTLPSCGYWYISPQYTKREVTDLVERIQPERILVEESFLHSIEDIESVILDTLCIFGTNFKLISTKYMKCSSIHRPETLAYVVPTSGSTGIPKCVYVPHASIMPNIYDFVHLFKVSSKDRIFCAAPLTFDPSVIDLFLAFCVGASLVMVPSSILRIPRLLLQVLLEQKVTILQATPTLLLSLGHHRVRESLLAQGSWLRVLALGGEVFPKGAVSHCIGGGCAAKIFNLYGLTEVSCWASVWEYVPEETGTSSEVEWMPIGKPLSYTEIKVLSKTGEEVEDGEGEIHVGGEQRVCLVDDGSGIGMEDQTLTHLKATGDLGLVKEGHIYCLGRLDDQIKRNGQKISLREIESVCSHFPYISQCIVVPDSKDRLVVCMCLFDKEVTVDDVWRDLRNCLAPWKIPDEVVFIDSVPFNTHGKIEMQELLSLVTKLHHTSRHAQTLQDFFKEIWIRTLGYEDVRKDDQFVLCGGNSLTAVQVNVAVEEFLGCEIPEFLDILLHKPYSEIVQVLRTYQLARKSSDFSRVVNKRAKTKHVSHLQLQHNNTNLTEIKKPDTDEVCNHQSAKESTMNAKPKDNASLDKSILLAAVSRRGVQLRESESSSLNLSSHTYLLRWKFNLGKCIDSSPLLVKHSCGDIFVFVGSHSHKFVCLDAVSGVEKWSCMLGDRVESSPAVSRDGVFVYVGCYDYHLYCLRVEDGSVAWKYKTRGEVKSSPVVDQETGCVVFGSHDKHLHCVCADGEAKWVLQVSSGSIFSSPFIGGTLVIVATLDGVVCGVDKASGGIRWRVTLNKPVFSSPIIYSKGVVFGTVEGLVLSYTLSGSPMWKFKTGGSIFSSPFVLNLSNSLQVIGIGSHDGCVYFFTHQGELMAKYCSASPVYATPFMYQEGEGVFGAVVCETLGRCCVLRVATDGKQEEGTTQRAGVEVMWKYEFPGELFASPIFYEKRLWIGCRDDFLYCFDAL
ncbi:beta-alanine-activating enzyme-like [Scylla paramamosain]|uniref:beta-alanine-activating enzyme-like n=1 Tax=Scylla paramamosain TaxID=85552 RepID=UPI003082D4D3